MEEWLDVEWESGDNEEMDRIDIEESSKEERTQEEEEVGVVSIIALLSPGDK
jgi:hypothetical protein